MSALYQKSIMTHTG